MPTHMHSCSCVQTHTFISIGKITAGMKVELGSTSAHQVQVSNARQEKASVKRSLARHGHSCMPRRLYLSPCVCFLGGHPCFAYLQKLFKLQVCVYTLHMHRRPPRGEDHTPEDARAHLFTEPCALVPARGPRPGTRTPTQACFTDASGALSLKESRE